MWKFLQRWWRARLRAIDREILWPSCKDIADDIEHARTAFIIHAASDAAYADFTADELARYVRELE